jgi:hypothetical protein
VHWFYADGDLHARNLYLLVVDTQGCTRFEYLPVAWGAPRSRSTATRW